MAPQSECWCHDLDVLTVQDHEAHGVRVAVAGPTLVQTGVLHLDTGQHHLHMVSRHMMSGDHGYLGPAGVGGHQAGHGPVPGLVIMAGDRQRPMVKIPENVIRGLRRGHGAVDSVRGAHIEIHWLLTHNWTFRLCNEKMPKLSQYSRLSNISLVRRPPSLTQDREVHRVSYMGLRVDLALVMSGVWHEAVLRTRGQWSINSWIEMRRGLLTTMVREYLLMAGCTVTATRLSLVNTNWPTASRLGSVVLLSSRIQDTFNVCIAWNTVYCEEYFVNGVEVVLCDMVFNSALMRSTLIIFQISPHYRFPVGILDGAV